MNTYQRFRTWASAGSASERTAFFSDAVFAIAMTLVAVEIRVPDAEPDQLARALAQQWTALAAYALSFAVVGAYWLTHHRLFRLLERYTAGFQRLNLLALLFVGLVAYGTNVLVEYGNHAPAVITYALVIAAIGLSQTALWAYAWRRGLFTSELDPALYRFMRNRSLTTPLVFLASIPVALASPDGAKWAWLAILAIDVALIARARREQTTAETPTTPQPSESESTDQE